MLRVGTIGLIQRKALSISMQGQASVTTGHIVNLVSNDVERLLQSIPFLPYLIISPVQLVVIVYLLWDLVGVYALCGAAIYMLFLPLHLTTGRVFHRLRRETAVVTDNRVKIVSEASCRPFMMPKSSDKFCS
jgi:ABC-type siderophore export system fused ATPase/permease subunit